MKDEETQSQIKTELRVDDDIILKVKQPEYTEEMYTLIKVQSSYLSQWLPWVDLLDNPLQQELTLTKAYKDTLNGDSYDMTIFYQGSIVGSLSFNEISQLNKNADIGYWLSQDMQGRGIVTKSVKKLLEFGFNDLGLHKVSLVAAVDNLPSNRVAERLNMGLEATLKDQILLQNKYHDVNVYSVINN